MLVPLLLLKHPWLVKAWTLPLNMSCGIWLQHVNNRSFKSSTLWCGTFMGQTCWSNTSQRRSIGLRSGELGGQVNTLNSFLNQFLFFGRVHYHAERGHGHQLILFLWTSVYSLQHVKVTATWIAEGSSAEPCPSNALPQPTRSFYNSGSWCQGFPR